MSASAKLAPMSEHDSADDNELYLVDGSGFIFRAYYAIAYSRGEMTNPAGVPIGAVYGYVSMLLKMLKDYHAPYMAVIFDAARENFRNDIYPEYKANRDETPEDLIPQFPIIREATEAFDIPAIEMPGYEADDLIASYAKLAKEQGKKVVIVSSDKDLMQLVDENVRMLDPMKGKWIGLDEVIEKFGVGPDKVIDVQALIGDSVDNVPGVPGIGPKTASQLINEYGDLETLLERASEIKQNKRRETLIENAENARVSKKLVTLVDDVDVPVALGDLQTHDPDKPNLVEFMQEHGFNSLLKRLGQAPVAPKAEAQSGLASASGQVQEIPDLQPIAQNEYVLINDAATLQDWVDEAYKEGLLVIDTETTSLTPAKADLVGISLAVKAGRAAYIPLGHAGEVFDLLSEPSAEDIPQMDMDEALKILKPVLEDPSVMKVAHNMKYDWQLFAARGIQISPCDDTMLISYVLDGSSHSHSMDNLSDRLLDHQPIKYEEVAGKGKNQVTFDQVKISDALDYAAEDADITLRLYHHLKPRLAREKMSFVYEVIERPLIPVIAAMELKGIKVDPKILNDMSQDFGKKLVILEQEIYALAGTEFNVGSPKQVGEILFGNMGLKGGKKTKTGQWSTDVSKLEQLAAEGHEIVVKILEWRQLSKLKSTYTDALQEEINSKTGRVHTSFSMAHTSTGRLSSSDPNLQNIPIRTEDGRKIREAFVADAGNIIVSVDYSQVELRLAAALAGIEALKMAFKNGDDIHTMTAAQVFDMPIEEVTSEVRRQAKAVNFGIIYGISGWGLAKQLGCDPGEASEFIRRYLDRFSELRDFMDNAKDEAKTHGFVRTLYGRKCFIRGAQDKNQAVKAGAERQAINAPLQGTAADIMKIAMGQMPAALSAAGLKTKMLLQVHDELIFEVPEAEKDNAMSVISDVMETAFKLPGFEIDVPLDAEAGAGSSWAEAH